MDAKKHSNGGGKYKFKYRLGDPKVYCDKTGMIVHMSETRTEWNGLRVWEKAWEPRQPQDLVKGYVDQQSIYGGRPIPEPVFRDVSS